MNTGTTEWYKLTDDKGKPSGEVELEIKWQTIFRLFIKAIGAEKLRKTETFGKNDVTYIYNIYMIFEPCSQTNY